MTPDLERLGDLLPRVVASIPNPRTKQGDTRVTEHIVIHQSVITDDESFVTEYSWDGQRFPDRQAALDHGFRMTGSDDFNVAVLTDGRLTWFGWMDRELDRDQLPAIAERIGVSA